MSRLHGARLMVRSIVGNDLAREYEWLHYCSRFLVPGTDDLIVQGVWDRWPQVPPGERQAEVFLEGVAPRPGDRVLDVGSGLGGLATRCLAVCPQLESVTGVDVNADHVRAANAAHAQHPNVSFFQADAATLGDEVDDRLVASLKEGFDRIYLMELSQDLGTQQFARVVAECRDRLRDGGVLALIVLTVDGEPQSILEQVISEMVVRKGAPNLAQIRAALQQPGYEIGEQNLTDISSRALVARVVNDPSIARAMVPPPLSWLFLRALRVGLDLADREVYSVTKIVATKGAAPCTEPLPPAASVVPAQPQLDLSS